MQSAPIRVLLIEDDPDDVRLFQLYLAEDDGWRIELEHRPTLKTGIERLAEQDFDAVLLDLGLPDSSGLETFYQVYRVKPDVPVVVSTVLDVDELANQAVKAGAQDYLVKDQLDGYTLTRTIRHAIDRAARQEAETALETMRQELHLARRIQQGLFPQQAPVLLGYDIAGASYPSTAVGGDYYDFLTMHDGSLGIAVGDASGHGLTVALGVICAGAIRLT
jgi:serine phosphatase RsbU (regulator of sigma subunit)